MEITYVTCPVCYGRGYIPIKFIEQSKTTNAEPQIMTRAKTCPKCDGRKELMIIKK